MKSELEYRSDESMVYADDYVVGTLAYSIIWGAPVHCVERKLAYGAYAEIGVAPVKYWVRFTDDNITVRYITGRVLEPGEKVILTQEREAGNDK